MAVAGRGCDPFVPFLPLRARETSMTQAEWLAELAAVVQALRRHRGLTQHRWRSGATGPTPWAR
jgi:hypothetical protein